MSPEFLTELGNAQRFVVCHGHEVRYAPQLGKWLVRVNCRWQFDETGIVIRWMKEIVRELWKFVVDAAPAERNQIIGFCKESERATKIDAAIRLAQTEPGIFVTADQLDADPMLTGTPSGAIDMRTGEFRQTTPADLITKSVAVDPVDGPCPRWMNFLNRIMAGDVNLIGYLQRLAGVCLTGDISTQEFWILHGGGANGKSVFIDTLISIWADYAGVAPNSLITTRFFDEHSTEIYDSFWKRLIAASESEEGAKLKTQLVKKFTGDKRIKARPMRKDFIEVTRTFKLLLVTNNRPKISEQTNAIWRRIRLIPFSVTIPQDEQDAGLLDKLKDEWPQILHWCIQGCLAWQRDGMQPPAAVMAASADYKSEQDLLADYVADRCVLGKCKIARNDLLTDYLSWCSSTGEKSPLNRNSFFEHVRQVAGVTDDRWRPLGVNDPVRGFKGIGLRYNAEIEGVSPCDMTQVLSPPRVRVGNVIGNDCHSLSQDDREGGQ